MKKIGVADSHLCTFCNIEAESLMHLFYNCYTIRKFWDDVSAWLYNSVRFNLNHNLKLIMFGTNTDRVLNLIILLAKFYIYNARSRNSRVTFIAFKNVFAYHFKTLCYISRISNSEEKFKKEWNFWKDLL